MEFGGKYPEHYKSAVQGAAAYTTVCEIGLLQFNTPAVTLPAHPRPTPQKTFSDELFLKFSKIFCNEHMGQILVRSYLCIAKPQNIFGSTQSLIKSFRIWNCTMSSACKHQRYGSGTPNSQEHRFQNGVIPIHKHQQR
jgi:hypothetical protein